MTQRNRSTLPLPNFLRRLLGRTCQACLEATGAAGCKIFCATHGGSAIYDLKDERLAQ